MSKERLFLDTSYIIALLNQKDNLHSKAKSLEGRFRAARIWVTESILAEVGNEMGGKGEFARQQAVSFIEDCYKNSSINVVSVDRVLFLQALERYKSRSDKTVGLVDCISFVVMKDRGLNIALSYDEDFIQAGFQALMR